MSLIIKNITGSPIEIAGMEVADGGNYPLQPGDESRVLSDDILVSNINSGDVEVYENTDLLTPSIAISSLSKQLTISLNSADMTSISRLKLSGNLTLTDLGDGEAEVHVNEYPQEVGGTVFQVTFSKSGGSGSTWMEWGEGGIFGNSVPYILPFACKLVAITYSNKVQNTDVDIGVFNLEEARTNQTDDYQILNWELRNKRSGRKTDLASMGSDQYFDAGDSVAVYKYDKGDNTDDAVVVLYFFVSAPNYEEVTYNKSNNFNR